LKAGISLSTRTNGAVVNESMETDVRGIFACGNVLHVHDLVDFVTEESRKAGLAVSKYLENQLAEARNMIELIPGEGVAYIVPQHVNIDNITDKVEFFLRVKKEYKDVNFVVRSGENIIKTNKKRHLAPAEMEQIKLKLIDLENIKDIKTIVIEVTK
jgi:pyruvate/2-oxoglutarate dehydrogenase complex dihydrolipoamide dehydrogenase (E3) component